MMKSNILDLKHYSFSAGERILIDANVWIYLFPFFQPVKKNERPTTEIYSRALKEIKKVGAHPILDPIILSEYLNRYCREVWRVNHKRNYSNFKDFRKSKDGQPVIYEACSFSKKILKLCDVSSIGAHELNLEKAINDCRTQVLDFNDALIVEICKKQDLKLMTNDGDFHSADVEILTTNRNLLNSSAKKEQKDYSTSSDS